MHSYETRDRKSEQLAIGLGWFSIALGVAELTSPRAVARLIGVPEDSSAPILRTMGAREIGSGLAILMQPSNAATVWSRVGGDMIDLSLLAYALSSEHTDKSLAGFATAAVAGVTALDVMCAQQLSETSRGAGVLQGKGYTVQVEKVTTINRPIEQVYDFWRDFANLPKFMRHLESVEFTGDRRSRWRAKAPAGLSVEWEAEMLEDRENEWIAWRSLPGSTVENSGSVRFHRAPGARGTEVRVQLQYKPPAGELGREIAWLFGEEPEQQIAEDLHRFKQLMETGEIPISEGPGLWRPAQPPADAEQIRNLVGVHR